MSDRRPSDSTATDASFETVNSNEDCINLTVDFDIEEDVEAELSEFARLSCTGHFEEAEILFQECLASHRNLFPVAAEYGDFLLRQGKFPELMGFTDEWLDSTKAEVQKENAIFELMTVIAQLHLPKATNTREAELAWVNNFWSHGLIQESLTSLGDVDQHLLDLFLRIAIMIHFDSADLIFNNVEKHLGAFGDGWNEFTGRLVVLFRHGRFWEAQGFLGYCLKYSSLRDQKRLLLQYCRAVGSGGVSQDETRMALMYLLATMTHLKLVAKSLHIIKATTSTEERSKAVPTSLDSATNDGDAEEIRALMIHEASKNHEDLIDGSPLHLAAKNGHTEAVISLLLERQSQGPRQAFSQYLRDPNPQDSRCRTPFHLAAQGGHSNVVEIYLNRVPELCVNDLTFGETLEAVAKEGHVEVMGLLLITALNVNSGSHEHYLKDFDDVPTADDLVRTNNDNLSQISINSERVDSENRVPEHRETSIGNANDNQLHHKR